MPSSPTTVSWRRFAGVSQSTSSIATVPRRERQQPEQQILVGGVDPPGGLGRDADRSLAGDRTQDVDVVRGEVDRHPDVADARRERTRTSTR